MSEGKARTALDFKRPSKALDDAIAAGGAGVRLLALKDITPSTEPYALLFARKIRERLGTNWAIGETGTAGPTGSRYGHNAGHSCVGVVGPNGESAITIETAMSDRMANMRTFSMAALELFEKALG